MTVSAFRPVAACLVAGGLAFVVSRLSVTTWAQFTVYAYLTTFSFGVLLFGALASHRALVIGLSTLLAAPWFIRFGGDALIAMPETSSARVGGQTMPVGALLCLVIFIRIAFARFWRANRFAERTLPDIFIVWFAVVVVVGVFYGLLRSQSLVTVLYAVQTLGPLTAYFVARFLLTNELDVRRAWGWVVAGASASAAILLANELSMRGIRRLFDEAIHGTIGVVNIYQANDYLPFLWALLIVISVPLLVDRETRTAKLLIALVPIAVCVGALYARGALLLLMLGLAAVLVSSPQLWSSVRRVIAAGAGALVLVTALVVTPAGVRLLERADSLIRGERLDAVIAGESSLRDRVFSMRVVAHYVGARPMFAAAFTPVPSQELSPRIASLSERQLFPAHNQYLDMALRGGFPLLAAFLMVLGIALYRAQSTWIGTRSKFGAQLSHGITVALFLTIVLGNMYEQNHVQPLTAFFLWFLAGIIEVVRRSNRLVGEREFHA